MRKYLLAFSHFLRQPGPGTQRRMHRSPSSTAPTWHKTSRPPRKPSWLSSSSRRSSLQLQQTYQMFTNPTNILGMATGMENSALENPMPLANALSGLMGGQPADRVGRSSYFLHPEPYLHGPGLWP